MITRRKLVIASALSVPALLIPNTVALAIGAPDDVFRGEAPEYKGVPFGQAPGDDGYCHEKYHPCYQELFGKLGHCSCGDGDCRATVWKANSKSPKGIDVVVNRGWRPLPANVWMPPEDSAVVPPELLREWAHVCAYETGGGYGVPAGLTIPCALINKQLG